MLPNRLKLRSDEQDRVCRILETDKSKAFLTSTKCTMACLRLLELQNVPLTIAHPAGGGFRSLAGRGALVTDAAFSPLFRFDTILGNAASFFA